MKLFSALGPGDIVAAHRTQVSGRPIISETSIIFSAQLLEYCRERNIETLAISSNSRADILHDGVLQLENRPRTREGKGGAWFHFSMITRAIYLAFRAWRFGADLAIIDSGSAHYFALGVFKLLGVSVAVNFHNTMWRYDFEPAPLLLRLTRSLDGWFFRRIALAAIGVSSECGRQVRQLAARPLPFFEYRAQFQREGFQLGQRISDGRSFGIIFAGRAEYNKGILDIAVIAERLRKRSPIPIFIEVCGDGPALPDLRRIVKENELDNIVRVRGKLARTELLQVYARVHAVLVPSRIREGLPMVCAEAVLSGLPIITSELSNAISILGPAIMEAEAENIDSYVKAILKLVEDRTLYDELSSACRGLGCQFLDRSQSFPAAVDRLIAHCFPTWQLLDNYAPLFSRLVPRN